MELNLERARAKYAEAQETVRIGKEDNDRDMIASGQRIMGLLEAHFGKSELQKKD